MSLSTPNQFLLDENVRVELANFLKRQKIDFKRLPKGTTDTALKTASKIEI